MLNKLYNRLSNITCKSPVLLLSDDAKLFLDNYSNTVYSIYDFKEDSCPINLDTFNSLLVVNCFSFSSVTSIPNCLYNVGFPIIFLSTEDTNIDNRFLCSIKTIIKDTSKNSNNKFLSVSEANKQYKELEVKTSLDEFCSNNSIELYYLREKTKQSSCSSKLVELLGDRKC